MADQSRAARGAHHGAPHAAPRPRSPSGDPVGGPVGGPAALEGPGAPTSPTRRPDGAPAAPDSEAARIADLTAEVSALDDRWRRTAADLDNLRKRVGADVERERAQASRRAASLLLPIVDNLDLALRHAAADPASLIQGILAVRDQAVAALALLGFPRRDDLGAVFDPARHEAVGAAPDSDAPPGTVVEVVRPRYGEGDAQLRPAGVVVATGPQEGGSEAQGSASAEPE